MLDEIKISEAIIKAYKEKLLKTLDVDVAIAGGGPAGLVCAYYLAKAGRKVTLFERKLSVGGGMWGGGMMFNEIVVQAQAKKILDEFGITTRKYGNNYFLADSVEAVSGLCFKVKKAGAQIFNLLSVEDVMIREKRVCGLVLNWTAVEMANLHVDPLTIRAKFVVDATGHACEVVRVVERKYPHPLNTKTGKILGEQPMWADKAENLTLENSREIFPGLYIAGMSANAVLGGPRMGPIFGGMLLSGQKVAEELIKKL